MANESVFPHQWNNLPDPRPTAVEGAMTAVKVHEPDWRKIVQKHFASSREPWIDTLGRALLDVVGPHDAGEATKAAIEVIRRQIAASMRRPLVILYACLGPRIRGQGRRWLLVLPCGALTVVWAETAANRLKTCYFTGAVAVQPKGKRWRHALRQQVQEYAAFDEQAGVYRYPAANDRREVSVVGATSELRYAVHFNAPDAWGFTSNDSGAEWRLPNWNWLQSENSSGNRADQAVVTPQDAP